jgi:hypothetical protein
MQFSIEKTVFLITKAFSIDLKLRSELVIEKSIPIPWIPLEF